MSNFEFFFFKKKEVLIHKCKLKTLGTGKTLSQYDPESIRVTGNIKCYQKCDNRDYYSHIVYYFVQYVNVKNCTIESVRIIYFVNK